MLLGLIALSGLCAGLAIVCWIQGEKLTEADQRERQADKAAVVADSQMHAAWEENKRLKQCLKALETRRVDDSLDRVNAALNNRKNPND